MDLRIRSQSVQSQTVETLRTAILKGVFQPGQKLVEASLCEQLGVSRSSLREALRELAAEKLVTNIPNRGPFVSTLAIDEMQEIYHVRAMLEGEACYLYASRVDAAGLKEMKEALAEFGRAVKKGDVMSRLDSTARFYEVVFAGCGNRVISELLRGLIARISFLRARSMSTAGRARHSAEELKLILTAFENGDARSARAAAISHVNKAEEAARLSFSESDAA